MVVPGAFVNAAVTGLSAGLYLFVGARVLREPRRSRAVAAFFLMTSVFLALAAARQVAAGLGERGWDFAIYAANIVPPAYTIVPLAYLAAQLAWGDERRSRLVGWTFAALATVGLVFAYAGGFDGPLESAWGTDWALRSVVAKAMIGLVLSGPGVVAAGVLLWGGRKLGPTGRRARLVGWACAVYYLVFFADAFGLAGVPLLAARLAVGVSAVLAYAAYARPSGGSEPGAAPPSTG